MDLLHSSLLTDEFWSPIWQSLKISTVSGIIVIVLGTLIGKYFSRKKIKGMSILETIIMLPIVLPPTVVGFLLVVVFGRNSLMGRIIEWIFNQPVIFTWWAAVIASAIVAFPLMYQSAKAAFQSVNNDIEAAARLDGANEWRVFLFISIPLASRVLISGCILSFARALGEFGATLMFAGNIPGKTQTVPTAIYIAMDSGNTNLAWAWVISIMVISFVMLLFVRSRQFQ
ncbi:molybdate ABC transporter permease subunit [Ornithinibacillus bavariensis]|uniref:molybdate ABC transporter permease subunit n=1 Tax=Ornithinibacillus bavariensis TaxID=545502 RepID=UPI000EF059BE|nr:molybdate ABC transporter permease subunit [Ornithinibacillus sp.]